MQFGYWRRLFNKGPGSRLGPAPQELDTHTRTCRPLRYTHTLRSSSADGNGDSCLRSSFRVESVFDTNFVFFSNLFGPSKREHLLLFILGDRVLAGRIEKVWSRKHQHSWLYSRSEPEHKP